MSKTVLFPQDKNHILKEAQENIRPILLKELAQLVKTTYLKVHNPLGLEDDTIKAVINCTTPVIDHLYNFYWDLAAIYRFKIGSNQLEFIFSGKSHYEKYLDDWRDAFEIWCEDFISSPHFMRAILEMTILHAHNRVATLAINRLKAYLTRYFQLKVYRYRGILPTRAA